MPEKPVEVPIDQVKAEPVSELLSYTNEIIEVSVTHKPVGSEVSMDRSQSENCILSPTPVYSQKRNRSLSAHDSFQSDVSGPPLT
jgi:hypothetical protein